MHLFWARCPATFVRAEVIKFSNTELLHNSVKLGHFNWISRCYYYQVGLVI